MRVIRSFNVGLCLILSESTAVRGRQLLEVRSWLDYRTIHFQHFCVFLKSHLALYKENIYKLLIVSVACIKCNFPLLLLLMFAKFSISEGNVLIWSLPFQNKIRHGDFKNDVTLRNTEKTTKLYKVEQISVSKFKDQSIYAVKWIPYWISNKFHRCRRSTGDMFSYRKDWFVLILHSFLLTVCVQMLSTPGASLGVSLRNKSPKIHSNVYLLFLVKFVQLWHVIPKLESGTESCSQTPYILTCTL